MNRRVRIVLATTLVLTGTFGLSLAAAVIAVAWLDRPQSEFPAWWSASATAAAFSAATMAAVFAGYAFNLETRRERRWLVTQRRAQASLIGAWLDEVKTVDGPFARETMLAPIESVGICVRNASELPVTNVTLSLYLVAWDVFGESHGWRLVGTRHEEVLPPFERANKYNFHFTPPRQDVREMIESWDLPVDVRPAVDMTFRDASGITWQRSTTGQLVQTFPDEFDPDLA